MDATRNGRLSVGELARAFFRLSPFIVGAALLVGFGVTLVTDDGDAGVSATARVGNTENVRWPYDDVTRDRVAGLLDDGTIEDQVRIGLDTPDDLLSLSVDVPASQAYVDVTAVARSTEVALQSADNAAAELVRADSERFTSDDAASIESISESVASLDATIAELDQRIDELTEAEAEAYELQRPGESENPEEARATWRRIDTERGVAATDRAQLSWRRSDAQQDLDALLRDYDPDAAMVEISRAARLDETAEDTSWLPGVLAGLTVLILGSFLAIGLDTSFGRVRNKGRVAAVTGLPVYDLSDGRIDRLRLDAMTSAGGRLGVVSLDGDTGLGVAEALAAAVSDSQLHRLEAEVLDSGNVMSASRDRSEDRARIVHLGSARQQPSEMMLILSTFVSDAYLAVGSRSRLTTVTETATSLEAHGIRVNGVLFLGGADRFAGRNTSSEVVSVATTSESEPTPVL